MNESRAIAAYLVNKYAKDDALYPKVHTWTINLNKIIKVLDYLQF